MQCTYIIVVITNDDEFWCNEANTTNDDLYKTINLFGQVLFVGLWFPLSRNIFFYFPIKSLYPCHCGKLLHIVIVMTTSY